MTKPDQHPALLLWYVTGAMDPPQVLEVERHLERCEACRIESDTLASMMRSLRAQSQTDHVSPADLVDHEEGRTPAVSSRRPVIERHLEECAGCREELEILSAARAREGSPGRMSFHAVPQERDRPGAGQGPSRRSWAVAAAAAAVLAIFLLLPAIVGSPGDGSGFPEPRRAVLPAPVRGPAGPSVLVEPGPWSLRIILPFGSPTGRYQIRVVREHGAPLPDNLIDASNTGDESLEMLLPALPGPGRYRMVLRSLDGPGEPPHIYPFEVVSR